MHDVTISDHKPVYTELIVIEVYSDEDDDDSEIWETLILYCWYISWLFDLKYNFDWILKYIYIYSWDFFFT